MDNCCKKSLKLLKCIFLPLLLPATGPVLPTYLKDGHPTQKFWLAPNWQIGGQQTKKGDYSQIWQGTSKSRPKKQFFSRICPFPTIKPDSHLIKKQNWCSWDKFTISRIFLFTTKNSNPWHKHEKWPPSDLTPWTLTLVGTYFHNMKVEKSKSISYFIWQNLNVK